MQRELTFSVQGLTQVLTAPGLKKALHFASQLEYQESKEVRFLIMSGF
jgi:hypothetical protein